MIITPNKTLIASLRNLGAPVINTSWLETPRSMPVHYHFNRERVQLGDVDLQHFNTNLHAIGLGEDENLVCKIKAISGVGRVHVLQASLN